VDKFIFLLMSAKTNVVVTTDITDIEFFACLLTKKSWLEHIMNFKTYKEEERQHQDEP